MQRWSGIAVALLSCLWTVGCKIAKGGGTEPEAVIAKDQPKGEPPAPKAEEPKAAEEPAAKQEGTEEGVSPEAEQPGDEEGAGDASVEEPEEQPLPAAPAEAPAVVRKRSSAEKPTEPTPGVQVLSLEENATLVAAHLAACERLLGAGKTHPAKRELAAANRALSYLDSQRVGSILSQALDQVGTRIKTKDAVGARRALRLAEDQIRDAEVAQPLAEPIEELADQLRTKDFEAAAQAIQELQDLLYKETERETRIVDTIRTGLVQAQFAISRYAPKVALAELKEARSHLRKLSEPAAPTE